MKSIAIAVSGSLFLLMSIYTPGFSPVIAAEKQELHQLSGCICDPDLAAKQLKIIRWNADKKLYDLGDTVRLAYDDQTKIAAADTALTLSDLRNGRMLLIINPFTRKSEQITGLPDLVRRKAHLKWETRGKQRLLTEIILVHTFDDETIGAVEEPSSPTGFAAAYGNKNIVELLLSKGANPSAKSNDGTTPAQFARQQGHPDIAQLLDSKPMFTTYKNNAHKFSIKYPNHWNVLTEAQIKSIAAGMSGTAPSFAAQSPTGGSMFVIAAPTTLVAEKAFAANAETGLRKQYSEFTGTPPASWVRTSDSTRDVNGVKALLVEWKMPPIQGVVLMQKHMCLIVGKRAFLVSATSDIGSWKENDSKWFTPIFESFQVTK